VAERAEKEERRSVDTWRERSVLVTGATGLLGSWLVSELVARGAAVTALVRDQVPFSLLYELGLHSRINSVRGQLEDYALLERVLGEYEVEIVFHLGAQTQVLVANRNPISTFEANIRGTYLLLEACRHAPLLKAVLVASSDKAYGSAKKLPYDEDTPLRGEHPYDMSKTCADLIANTYARSFGLPLCITRCGNLYGGGDMNFDRIVPGTIRSAYYNQAPVIRSDGKPIRDYFYVRDAVSAYLMLAEKMLTGGVLGEAFNFSNELQISVLDLTRRILAGMGREDLQPVILGQNCGEIRDQWLSAAKARERLGWTPGYTLDQALAETIQWYLGFFEKKQRWEQSLRSHA
jgi:CDP-glucose 4,6-dehydratase